MPQVRTENEEREIHGRLLLKNAAGSCGRVYCRDSRMMCKFRTMSTCVDVPAMLRQSLLYLREDQGVFVKAK